jgi:hypothetical protein
MSAHVNLDALIRREDFDETDIPGRSPGSRKDKLSINDFVRGEYFFSGLRKPDFQRETSEWDAKKILNLVESFLAGDLIPAIILWLSKDNLTFVIDGSHRLSALAAWVNDDYGDGEISKQFFDGIIPEEQIEIAAASRKLINKKIGPYSDHKLATTHPDKVSAEIVSRSKKLATLAIQVQWVEGDSKNAENSFRKINEQGVPINSTEKKILQSRRKPMGIASRAVIRSGKGHNYWSKFQPDIQAKLQDLACNINTLLFIPKFKNPISTLDLPMAGKIYSAGALPLIWDYIRIVNPPNKLGSDGLEIDDPDGNGTLGFLGECKKIAEILNSDDQSSLGLHPIVYVYSESGRHKPASFYAITDLVLELEKKKSFEKFIYARKDFEALLLANDYVIQQIVRQYRSAIGSYQQIKEFYLACIEKLNAKVPVENVIEEINKTPQFNFLTKQPEVELPSPDKQDFSRAVKSRTYIKTALQSVPRCAICGGFVHTNSVSIDHKTDKKHGGDASAQNAQVTHPYCNSAKDKLVKLGLPRS